jgi:hypothetical protein
MAFRTGLLNFSKGELAPELIARADVSAYSAGVRRGRNVRVMKYGGLEKRMGTRFVYEVDDDTHPSRVIPFQFSDEQTYALLLGQGYMRPAALGGMVLEQEIIVTAITNEINAKVTAPNHGYLAGDTIFFQGIEGMTELNFGSWKVMTVIDDDNFLLLQGTVTFGVFTGCTGGITPPSPPSNPVPPAVPPVVPPPDPPPVTHFEFDPSVFQNIWL